MEALPLQKGESHMLPGGAMRTTDPEQAGIAHDIARREVTTDAAELAEAIAASLESPTPPPYIASLESETPQPQPQVVPMEPASSAGVEDGRCCLICLSAPRGIRLSPCGKHASESGPSSESLVFGTS